MGEPRFALVIPLAMLAGATVPFHVLPHFSSRDLFFGVTVPVSVPDSTEGRAALRRYRTLIWSVGLVMMGLLLITGPALRQGVFVAGMLLQMVVPFVAFVAFVAFARAHREVMPHSISQATIREADLTPRDGVPGGPLAQLGPFVILSAATSYLAAHWDQVPERFPIHWDLAGQPSG